MVAEDKRFTLRIDGEVFEKVVKSAEENKRSAAKEIEYILEQYFAEKEKRT